MATVSDITVTPTSGLIHIDALLDTGPDWNYLTPAGNTILYTFSVASGNEATQGGQTAFSASQQTHARAAFAVLAALTGIVFTETVSGATADVHLAAINIAGVNTSGLCSWNSSYNYSGNTVTAYDAQAYVYLDNVEFAATNSNLAPGTTGFQTLLHELGHMIGLKHPFEGSTHLAPGDDNTSNTLLSYTNVGGPYADFSPYDIAALKWLYGGDGLGGALGINSTGGGRYLAGTSFSDTLTGSAANDKLEGDGGDDILNGGGGTDTAVFRGNFGSYTVLDLGGGSVRVIGADGSDTLNSVELLKFDDQSVQAPNVATPPPPGDTTAPAAPTASLVKNAAGFVAGNQPLVGGLAEGNAKVEVLSGTSVVATAMASSGGTWSVATAVLADGLNQTLTVRATDAAGNVSLPSAALQFSVDTVAPAAPTATVNVSSNGAVLFSGNGEAGSTIRLTNANAVIAEGTVGAGGSWSLGGTTLANGNYDVTVSAIDKADNSSVANKHLLFAVGSSTNLGGTSGNDTLLPTAGNNVIDGGAGTDTANYTGPRGNYDVVRDDSGFVVTARSGTDGTDLLRNVEAVKFSDSTLKLEYDDVVQALYLAYFGRAADSGGLSSFQSQLSQLDAPYTFSAVSAAYDKNAGLHSLIDSFGASAESAALYPGSTASFIAAVYQNIFNRAPDAGGAAFWTNAIDSGNLSRANASLSIMAGALANTTTQGVLDGKLVNNKITIASDFTLAIDTPAELNAYVGNGAAATVRTMLGTVTATTDIAAFQATIASTLLKMSGAGVQTAASASLYEAELPAQPVTLVGWHAMSMTDLPL
ncbi:Ig-like domain-containing protein [Massilia aquatica]|uniref:DUF4214 domain-containing protein n=1 Tax=Massilia aquatica TaxID=2609000 RepID=A0ABX0MGU6_9BURK|nr:Ig-like domain-containing protein [Massilia aquatica]NHZ44140.1 DUF4214 domain-containing protein [Massilia aquatica]